MKETNVPDIVISDSRIENYAEKVTTPESQAIRDLVKSSDSELEYIDMLSGNLVGQLLKMLIKLSSAKRILEIGTFTGYSALTMAEALPEDGKITTLEMNLRYQELAEKHFTKYDLHNKIELIKGNAQELLDKIQPEFDLIFLDADKINYSLYYEKVIPLLKTGGLLVADNTLWGGNVINPTDAKTRAIDNFNQLVLKDDRVEQVLIPVRDGISLIRKVASK